MAAPVAQGDGTGLAPAYAAARARWGLVAVLFLVAAISWVWTVREMQGMDAGPWTSLGSLGWFLGIWVVMMTAMMFPTVAPTIALYAKMTKERSALLPWLFAAGYLLVWAGAGLVAYVLGRLAISLFGDALAWDNAGRAIAGATLIVAAVYELTPLKNVCLAKCHSPLGTLLGSWRDGRQAPSTWGRATARGAPDAAGP
jgi:predicted metal-binding membrane protein